MADSIAKMEVPFADLARQHAPIADDLRDAFERVLDSNGFVLGDEVERFEAEFADYCGVAHCVGVNSGTAALALMLSAAGIGAGDEVIVPGHTFIASALSVLHAGATPVAVDVRREDGLLDSDAVEAAVGTQTAAILAVHLYGQVCDMDRLRAIADRHELALFEDAAQAHGATYRDRRAGGFGLAAGFSFYPSKNLGALGDGGAICTDDAELARQARGLRDLGRNDGRGHLGVGYNERLDGIQAAFLRVKLRHLDAWIGQRRAIAARYRRALDGAVELLEETEHSPCSYHLFPIRIDHRDAFADALKQHGIASGVHYPLALCEQPALPMLAGADTPNALDWAARELSLPMFAEMSELEMQAVARAVRSLAGNSCPNEAPLQAGQGDLGGYP
jgi:dTDP-4-amino-4,6-dideoxygalactose transaminase